MKILVFNEMGELIETAEEVPVREFLKKFPKGYFSIIFWSFKDAELYERFQGKYGLGWGKPHIPLPEPLITTIGLLGIQDELSN